MNFQILMINLKGISIYYNNSKVQTVKELEEFSKTIHNKPCAYFGQTGNSMYSPS
jgi:hypothetical protein